MFPGQERDLGGQVTVATAPDENFRSQMTLPPATIDRVGGPRGLPYLTSNRGLQGLTTGISHDIGSQSTNQHPTGTGGKHGACHTARVGWHSEEKVTPIGKTWFQKE